MSITLAYPSNG